MADAPVPAKIISPTPMPVEIVAGASSGDSPAPSTTTAEQDRGSEAKRALSAVIPPTTTSEQDRKTAGQRRVNIIWESTQAMIAGAVIATTLYVDASVALRVAGLPINEVSNSALMQLNVMAALVTGFYFGRTNHQRTGGVGGNEAMGTR